MGAEIFTKHFSPQDFKRFNQRLKHESSLLHSWIEEGEFSSTGFSAGIELEAWLLDARYQPSPQNKAFLQKLQHPQVVHELARYCIELNGEPHDLHKPHALSAMHQELKSLWNACVEAAHKMHSHVLMAGTAPTLHDSMITPKMMSDSKRFFALQDQLLSSVQNQSVDVSITGKDALRLSRRDLLLASSAAALHIHLKTPAHQLHRFFNASQVVSPAMVAVSANSPFLFGRDLWNDSRVPIFERSLNFSTRQRPQEHPRVFFGSGFEGPGLGKYFHVNLQHHQALLAPDLHSTGPQHNPSLIAHLNLHNGTIWRWNRIVPADLLKNPHQKAAGVLQKRHLRIEHRCADSGPTVIDSIANIAFYLGCTYALATEWPAVESELSYPLLERAFYQTARHGLGAYVNWRHGRSIRMKNLLLQELIPKAKWGLVQLGVPREEVEFFIQDVVYNRVFTERTGSRWQREYAKAHGHDFARLTSRYLELQQEGLPVHTWPV